MYNYPIVIVLLSDKKCKSITKTDKKIFINIQTTPLITKDLHKTPDKTRKYML